ALAAEKRSKALAVEGFESEMKIKLDMLHSQLHDELEANSASWQVELQMERHAQEARVEGWKAQSSRYEAEAEPSGQHAGL
ncbi:unnamed protein product, partial [Symbiodinium pilosum]